MAKQILSIIFITMAIILCLAVEPSETKPKSYYKKGCEKFGHACYGGHGKRSAETTVTLQDVQSLINASEGGQYDGRILNLLDQILLRYNSAGKLNRQTPFEANDYNYN